MSPANVQPHSFCHGITWFSCPQAKRIHISNKLQRSQSADGKNEKSTQIITLKQLSKCQASTIKFKMLPAHPIQYITKFVTVPLSKSILLVSANKLLFSAFQFYYIALSNICVYNLVIPLDFARSKSHARGMPSPRAGLQYKWVCTFQQLSCSKCKLLPPLLYLL